MNLLYRFRIPLLWVAAALLAFLFTLQFGPKSPQGSVEAEAAPKSASITLDGRGVGKKTTVGVGTHTIKASKKGFATQSQTISLKENETIQVGFVLEPTTPETTNWYTEHPSDRLLGEGITGRLADYGSDVATKENGLLQLLPFTYSDGAGGFVTIGHGIPVSGSSQPAIYVSAKTPLDRQNAVVWVRGQGFDPTKMDFVFQEEINPFGEGHKE